MAFETGSSKFDVLVHRTQTTPSARLQESMCPIDVKPLLLIPVCWTACASKSLRRAEAALLRKNESFDDDFTVYRILVDGNRYGLQLFCSWLVPRERVPRLKRVAIQKDAELAASDFSGKKAMKNHRQVRFKLSTH